MSKRIAFLGLLAVLSMTIWSPPAEARWGGGWRGVGLGGGVGWRGAGLGWRGAGLGWRGAGLGWRGAGWGAAALGLGLGLGYGGYYGAYAYPYYARYDDDPYYGYGYGAYGGYGGVYPAYASCGYRAVIGPYGYVRRVYACY